MDPMVRIETILAEVAALLEDVKRSDDSLTLGESHQLYAKTREAEAWLLSVRQALDPARTPLPEPKHDS